MTKRIGLIDIGTLANLSGVNASTIRTWEARYGALSPQKSTTGRRLYDATEVERLIVIGRLVEQGFKISTLAQLALDELRALKDRTTATMAEGGAVSGFAGLNDAIGAYDADRFRRLVAYVLAEVEPVAAVEQVLLPILHRMGDLWTCGDLDIGLEHTLTAIIRHELTTRLDGLRVVSRKPTIGFATLPGERHELGALMGAYLAATLLHRIVYFGADLPVEDLARSAERQNVALMVISCPRFDADKAAALARLDTTLPDAVPVWVGCADPEGIASQVPARAAGIASFSGLVGWLSARFG